jgi:hypothetical protein
MPTKVEFFHATNIVELETEINKFLEKHPVIISSQMAQSSYVLGEGDDAESTTKVTVNIYYQTIDKP